MHHLNNNKKNNAVVITAATTLPTLATIIVILSSWITNPVAATTTTSNTPSNTTLSSRLELSPQPIYQEHVRDVSETPINQTHAQLIVEGNGTLTLPNSTETRRTTSTGSGIVSLLGTFAGEEILITEDGSENATAISYEIARSNKEEGIGKGIAIAIIHTNSTGRLAPLDGMILAGQEEFQPDGRALLTFWEWQSGIPLSPTATNQGPPLMNTTTTTTNATGNDANVTATTQEEGEQQQCQLEITTNEETFELGESVTITVTNDDDEALEFPNSVLGLEIENRDTGEAYPLFSAQAITTLEPGESRTFEFTYEELVSEIGAGTIEASVSGGDGCSASITSFTLAESSSSTN
jgi:hypothetical protein